ncbi:DNA polymerase Y family protein [Granulicella sp. WH15]|uniref:DNA polymerase Y family protein n=1 Tax=Granulicella sp. WH15 TaxID=2602070 RepID=UPI0013677ED4|nr:DNA polymerase Y family protein [Granulicella sp. WH15]QHN02753.1 DNA polymerase Y family protein [Granulicella sp. WH15]
MTKPPELYACLYVREFPGQALLRLRADLHGRPCVVLEGEPPSERVCSLNSKARLQGIRHGMTRVEVETFPDPVILSRSPTAESGAKSILLECAGAFSPRIEECSNDLAFLCVIDIAGTRGLFGPPAMLAQSLLQRVRSLGISARITVSHNFHAAASLARGPLSKSAIQIISLNEEADALSPLPLTVLDLTEAQAETFALWGIRSLGALAALPEKELIARTGQEGRRLRELALGIHPHLFQPIEPPYILEERIEFDAPVEPLDSLLLAVGVILDQLILRATARVFSLSALTVTLTLDDGGLHTRTIRPAQPSTDKQLWIKLLHLDMQAHPPSAAILAVTASAEPGSTTKIQLGLFSPQLPEADRLDVTLARIRAIVGENNVGRAVLQDSHSTEPFRMEAFTVPSGESDVAAAEQARASIRKLRPLESASVTLQNLRPSMFFFREQRYVVERAYGPWIVGGDWWAQTLWGCEQWDLIARSQDGSMLYCCMMRDLLEHKWQMAALYD